MNIPSEDIKDILESKSSLGLSFTDDLFIGKEPDAPDNCTTIFDSVSRGPMVYLDNSLTWQRPSVQIRTRNNSYTVGLDLAYNIMNFLHNKGAEEWNNTIYDSIICTSGPVLLDWDELDRSRFVINFDMYRHE